MSRNLMSTLWLLLVTSVTFSCSTHQSSGPENSAAYNDFFPTKLPQVGEKVPATHTDTGSKYAIASQNKEASLAAEEIFNAGGNIIDAAIATSFALSVVRPQSTGIGGGGFLLYYEAKTGKTYAYDFRETAPLKAFSEMYINSDGSLNSDLSKNGILAAGVPGLVAGLYEMHQRHGKLEWSKLLEPAIRLAEQGFPVYEHLARALKGQEENLSKNAAANKIFLKKNKSVYELNETLVQTDLAKTLKSIQQKGKDGFYKSWVASAIINEFAQNGGLLEKKDLDTYEVKVRQPVVGIYRGYPIASMPPPSSGGTHVIQILNVLENADLYSTGAGSVDSIALTVRAMQQAFADRAMYMGDSDFVEVPLKNLLSKSYAKQVYGDISKQKRAASTAVKPGSFKTESSETTHFSLMDASGNAVSSTQTINGWFGNAMVVSGTGIVLNNEMDDFAAKVGASNLYGAIGGEPNKIEARKRPLSSMSPSIVFDPETRKPLLALGSPSGTRIITCTLLSILNVLEYGMSLEDAELALRYHHQWQPDKIFVEAPGFSEPVQQELESLGYEIEEKDLMCSIQAVQNLNPGLKAVSDPRGQGQAIAN